MICSRGFGSAGELGELKDTCYRPLQAKSLKMQNRIFLKSSDGASTRITRAIPIASCRICTYMQCVVNLLGRSLAGKGERRGLAAGLDLVPALIFGGFLR